MTALALALQLSAAHAQEACVEETSDPNSVVFTHVPARPVSGRDGRLYVGADDVLGDDEHSYGSAYTGVFAPMTDGALRATATYDLVNGYADVETWLFGYGEAGVEVRMEARSFSGQVLCTDSDLLLRVQYNGGAYITPGVRSLGCDLPSGTTAVTIEVEAHAWIVVGGASGAEAWATVQIVDVGFESCTGSCGSTCGPVTLNGRTCFCDEACSSFGDCCADAAEECVPDSCWEQCGGASAGGSCFCDDLCTGLGDCCDDFADSCE